MTTLAHLIGTNFAVSAAWFLALWLLSLPKRDPSFIDSWWPLGMVMLAWLSFAHAPERGPHAWVLVILVTIWGSRLGIYLFIRWRQQGMDRRYAVLMKSAKRDRAWSYPLASILIVFALQMLLQFVVSLPVQLGILGTGASFGPLAWVGALLAAAGILVETVADWQLARFKSQPKNKGAALDTGLWRYSRHPNHFGDACVWWGLYMIASETGLGLWAAPGPLLLTFLLLRVSGAPTIEGHLTETRPGYANYLRRTSAFVPWPPKPD